MNGFDDFDTQIQSDEFLGVDEYNGPDYADEHEVSEMGEVEIPSEEDMVAMFRFFHICVED